MGSDLRALTDSGARLVGVALTEHGSAPHAECTYRALWSMPDGPAQIRRLHAILDRAGWHDYFVAAETTEKSGSTAAEPPGPGESAP